MKKSFQKEVTFTIKTFERPDSFLRLVKSIEKHYPWSRVWVLDDSEHPYAPYLLRHTELNWSVLPCPYDIGLGAGRNLLVEAVETPYFVLLDDDYEIQKPIFGKMLAYLKKQNLDLVAVTLWNTSKNKEDAICQNAMVAGDRLIQTKVPFTDVGEANMVNNCFVADTTAIRQLGWDPVFKIAGEHSDFGLRSTGLGYRFRILRLDGVLHHQDRPPAYKKMRGRSHASLLLDKYGCKEFHPANGKVLPIKPGTNYKEAALRVGHFGV